MKLIVLGATGMLGYEVFRVASKRSIEVHGIVRNKSLLAGRVDTDARNLHVIDDVRDLDAIEKVISEVKPNYIINCVGIVKQSELAEDYYESISINSLLPHQLEKLGRKYDFRLIHVSTDCVFDGAKGNYKETDLPNAYDLYGKSKHLGEVGNGCGITLRTSIIGHEITKQTHGLLEWILGQQGKVKGFKKAIFSGLTTLELTNVILDVVIPQNIASGICQVASQPISKYDLITLIADVYNKKIDIEPSEDFVIDRSLDGSKFASLTGYKVPAWPDQIESMKNDFHQGF